MKNMRTFAPSPALRGSVSLPGDKSMSHRAALFAALAKGQSRIENFLIAGVTERMLYALTELSISWRLEKNLLEITSEGFSNFKRPTRPLDCGNSATTMRMLAGAIAAVGIPSVLDGSDGLRRRPMNRIVVPLRELGCEIQSVDGRAPLTFTGFRDRSSKQTEFNLMVASAQVKTCLLLAGLTAEQPITIIEPGPSRDHTERMLQGMGVEIRKEALEGASQTSAIKTTIAPTPALTPIRMRLPGDFSSAAFIITAGLITPGSDILIQDVGLNPTRTGLIDALKSMGAFIEVKRQGHQNGEPVGDLHVRHSNLSGTLISGKQVVRMIDEFPVFAIAAACADSETIVRDAEELRYKESDRIQILCEQMRAVGIVVEERQDGFRLPGNTPPQGGIVHPHGDHRIAMALAIAGFAAKAAVTIQDPEIIQESFPAFEGTFEKLGARID